MIPDKELIEIIKQTKIIPDEQLSEAAARAQSETIPLSQYIVDKNLVSENSLFESIANYYKIPFIDLRRATIRKDILTLIPETIVQSYQIVAFEKTETGLKVATVDPKNLQIIEFLRKKTGLSILVNVTTPSSVKEILSQFHKGLSSEFKKISKAEESNDSSKIEDLKQLAQDLPIVRIVDTLLEYAIFEEASDIHIEPTEKDILIRYRVDGILREVMRLPKKVQAGITARIKILSNLKIDEHRLPQDGRFKISTADYKIAFRVSIIPVFDGEKIVMRLLNESAKILSLEQIGLQLKALDVIKINVKKSQGMILVTGPTGSGKTTTLYTILNILNDPKVNISTIEDPIEYRMQRVNQSQVNPKIGFTFANGLRSLLRQDPNIIMVGEIRDQETAEIATHAAMTGHLVLSTLHTNDAATTLPRLEEMGVPPFLVATTTNIVIGQRLVRRICSNCINSYTLSTKAINELKKSYDLSAIFQVLQDQGIILSSKAPIESLLFYKGKGCKQCNNSGYKGRVGIYEVLEVTKDIQKLITEKASKLDILAAARANGMLTMVEDGFIKAKNGVTSIEEVLRATQE
ncbi:MAG: ATPase, T2SS/T4P/T4SS family [Patescibacteria group bacterium]|nr:ATPase, T2SS/T4P/T4SS family [Patescibacteria group bacterium]MDD5715105.1 ATPase, T2SS/T4P/T4SS family [Patescibacteria group bacterium]